MEEKKETEVKKDLEQQNEKAAKVKKTETQKTTTKKNITANKEATGTKKTTTKKVGSNTVVERINEEKEAKVENPEIKVNKNTVNEIDAMEKELKQVEEELQAIEKENKITIKKEKPKFEPAKKAEPKKKKHRILKTILIVMILAIIVFLINYVRNYYIIHDLVEKQTKLLDCTNYSFEVQYYSLNNENDRNTLKHYYKDGKFMLIREVENTVIIWHDEETKETMFITPQELKASVQKNSEMVLTSNLVSQDLKDIEVWSFMLLISTEEVDGQECYKIRFADSMTLWVNKENGLVIKSTNGKTVIDGKEYDNISERTNIKMNELTDMDMSRPNLMGYNIETTE